MNRDWLRDMERVENFKHAEKLCNGIRPMFHGMFEMPEPDIVALEYWLQQYAAEKERVSIALSAYQGLAENTVTLGEYQSLLDKHTAMTKAYRAEKSREQKLREAMERVKDYLDRDMFASAFHELESSLYPKEEEAK